MSGKQIVVSPSIAKNKSETVAMIRKQTKTVNLLTVMRKRDLSLTTGQSESDDEA